MMQYASDGQWGRKLRHSFHLGLHYPKSASNIVADRRCVTSNISDWQQESEGGCLTVFSADASEPPGTDIYSNSCALHSFPVQDPVFTTMSS